MSDSNVSKTQQQSATSANNLHTTLDDQSKDLVDKSKEYLEKNNSTVQAASSKGSTKTSVRGMNNILDALVSKGMLTMDQANVIKFQSINSNKSFDEVLKASNLITVQDVARTYAEMRGLGFADLRNMIIPNEVLNKVPKDVALNNLVIVFEDLPNKMKVAMVDPLDLQKVKLIESIAKKPVESYYAAEDDIRYLIDSRYGAQISKEVAEAMQEVGETLLDMSKPIDEESSQDLENAPIIRIVNMVLEYGIKNKASDVHIEPRENRIVVRFRVRGILMEKLTIPRKLLSAVITRIKILSSLKIDEHRIPQDGRFQVRDESNLIDIRVSTIPSVFGEKVVMRLLPKTQGILDIEATGMRGVALQRMKKALKKTQGIILVTGPTGSGKTQTLASSLKVLNSPEVNIMTLEDPVEIQIDGVNQVQVNSEVGLTFANGLRSFLRQDPDIIMVGEIRDSETANLATQAALVGRLVLSTVHTNSAAGAFPRLIDMGVEPFLLASTVNLVIGQRLVRTLCECKAPYEASKELMQEIHQVLDILKSINVYNDDHELSMHFGPEVEKVTLYKPVGCPKCNDTGYIGRTGIFEALEMSEKIAEVAMQKKSIKEINDIAISEGMISIIQDGFIKALEGITSIEEVLRVKNE